MTDQQFDNLAKQLSSVASRRGVLKGALAVALGGIATRFRGDQADAARRPACGRLHQDCSSAACCPGFACEADACCRPTNETCYEDTDCCSGNVCRPNPHGMGQRCLPPGDVGAACVSDTDCATGICDLYTGTCASLCVATCTVADDSCVPGGQFTCCGTGGGECGCTTDIEGNPFCAGVGVCAPCASNEDCALMGAYTFPFADQLVCVNTPDAGPCCSGDFATACALPCDLFEAGSAEALGVASAFGGVFDGFDAE
jgi:hypothetical protein